MDIVESDAPLISSLGEVLIRKALCQLEKWERMGWHYPVSVNVGALHFLDPDFLDKWNGLWLDFPGISRSALSVEISECATLRAL